MNGLLDPQNRRDFVKNAAIVSVGGIATLVFACSSKTQGQTASVCYAPEKLTDKERKAYENVAYVEQTLTPTKRCDNCNLWIAAADGKACGGCKILKGPINPAGFCTVWAPGGGKKG